MGIQQKSFIMTQLVGHVKNIIEMSPLQEIWMSFGDISSSTLALLVRFVGSSEVL